MRLLHVIDAPTVTSGSDAEEADERTKPKSDEEIIEAADQSAESEAEAQAEADLEVAQRKATRTDGHTDGYQRRRRQRRDPQWTTIAEPATMSTADTRPLCGDRQSGRP